MEKLEWCRSIRWWKNFEDIFIRFDVIHERDGQTDGQTLRDSKDRACITSRVKNWDENLARKQKHTAHKLKNKSNRSTELGPGA